MDTKALLHMLDVKLPGERPTAEELLVSIEKLFLAPNASANVAVTSSAGAELGYCAFCTVAADGKTRRIEAGTYEVSVGDGTSSAFTPQQVVVTGETQVLPL